MQIQQKSVSAIILLTLALVASIQTTGWARMLDAENNPERALQNQANRKCIRYTELEYLRYMVKQQIEQNDNSRRPDTEEDKPPCLNRKGKPIFKK